MSVTVGGVRVCAVTTHSQSHEIESHSPESHIPPVHTHCSSHTRLTIIAETSKGQGTGWHGMLATYGMPQRGLGGV